MYQRSINEEFNGLPAENAALEDAHLDSAIDEAQVG
jgi:hypothetical protein